MEFHEIAGVYTDLSLPQLRFLEGAISLIPFAQAMTQQDVCVFMEAREGNFFVVGAYGRTVIEQLGDNYYLVSGDKNPCWQEVLQRGKEAQCVIKHEESTEQDLIIAFPITDNGGRVIGGISFKFLGVDDRLIASGLDSYFVLIETAYMAMIVPQSNGTLLEENISFHDGMLIFDSDGKILYANEPARRLVDLLGLDRRVIGTSIFASNLKLSLIRESMDENKASRTEEMYDDLIVEQVLLPVSWGIKNLRNVLLLRDKTMLRKKEKELLVKNSVIKEIHHRVKNNLQIIAGILRMEGRRTKSEEVREKLFESIHRIESIALVHEFVSHYEADYISLRTISEELMRLLTMSFVAPGYEISMRFHGEDLILPSDKAGYVSLVLNELITNSIQHGFIEGEIREGIIEVSVHRMDSGEVLLTVKDTGRGLPEDFSLDKTNLGLAIVGQLVSDELSGELYVGDCKERGTEFCIRCKGDDVYESGSSR